MEVSVTEYHGKIDATSSGSMHVEFFDRSEAVGQKNGLPDYQMREYVMIHYPGGKDRQIFPVTDEHRTRWPRQYAAFKNVNQSQIVGRPIEEWPVASRAQVDLLKVLNLYSVDQLAQASDSVIERIGLGGRELREKARLYVKEAESGDGLASLVSQLEAMKDEIAELKAEKEELKKQAVKKEKDK